VTFDGESYAGHCLNLSLKRESAVWNYDLNYQQKSPTFRAENGFIISNDTRNLRFWMGPIIRPRSDYLFRIKPMVSAGYNWNYAGIEEGRWITLTLSNDIIGLLYLSLCQQWESERFRDLWYGNIKQFRIRLEGYTSYKFKFGFDICQGNSIARNISPPQLGRGYEFNIWLNYKLISRIIISPDWAFSKLNTMEGARIFRGHILRSRQTIQFNRNLSTRVVGQYNSFSRKFSFEPLLTYKFDAASMIYMGYSQEMAITVENKAETESRQYFAKFQFLVM
jgi:hypothetical protein